MISNDAWQHLSAFLAEHLASWMAERRASRAEKAEQPQAAQTQAAARGKKRRKVVAEKYELPKFYLIRVSLFLLCILLFLISTIGNSHLH